MSVPKYDQMLRPILALANEGPITRKEIPKAMTEFFKLTQAEIEETIQSGGNKLKNRTGWAMTFLTKGGLIEKTALKTYQATYFGKQFLQEHPNNITGKDLAKIPGWIEAWQKNQKDEQESPIITEDNTGTTPIEAIDQAIELLDNEIKSQLLDNILNQSPTFFEKLVLDVLLAMGYGGNRLDAAEHLGKSNDEGIDGRINQDSLGLDQILVQAKRYSPENIIDRKTIQAFIGSMTGQGVNKGIFITTSGFNKNAKEFILRGISAKVILIDGKKLLDLMLQYNIGTRVEKSIKVKAIDQNYFSDED
jgi:restriction system protein